MRLRIAAAFATIALSAGSTSAQAPITNVPATFTAGSVAPDPGVITGGYYVGPYSGTIQLGGTTIPVVFNCVDFFHDVSVPDSWNASLSNLGSSLGVGSLTRLTGGVTVDGTLFSAIQVYKAAAYLTSLYSSAPSTDVANTIRIQDEIWEMTSLFYTGNVNGDHSLYATQTSRTDGYSYSAPVSSSALATDIANFSNESGFDYSNYWVVSPTDLRDAGGAQEFIIHQTVTPEPGTLVLFGSGMFSVVGGGFFRRRRPKNAA